MTHGGAASLSSRLAANLGRVLLGKPRLIRMTLAALFADGHVLLEDVPGTGKTMLARTLALSLEASFGRIQFTPDLLPSDITGISIFNEAMRQFEFRRGPVFCQILLADELNRTTPRTQAALLESMGERTVTADGSTYRLDDLFMVLATQNPLEQHGVYVLPEAQLDRFLMKLSVGYPGSESEVAMLEAQRERHPIESVTPVATAADILAARAEVRRVHMDADLSEYVVRIVEASRSHDEVMLGGSPRASLGIYRTAQALTWMDGGGYVVPETIKEAAVPVLRHRLMLKPQARIGGVRPDAIIEEILREVPVPLAR